MIRGQSMLITIASLAAKDRRRFPKLESWRQNYGDGAFIPPKKARLEDSIALATCLATQIWFDPNQLPFTRLLRMLGAWVLMKQATPQS